MNMTLSNKFREFLKDSIYLMIEIMGLFWELIVVTIRLSMNHKIFMISLLVCLIVTEPEFKNILFNTINLVKNS